MKSDQIYRHISRSTRSRFSCLKSEIQIKSSHMQLKKKNAENFQHQSAYLPRGLKKERNKKSGTQLISISFSLFHDETDNVIDHSKSLGYFLLPSSPISKSIRVSSNLFLDFWHKRKASTCIFHHKKTVRSSKSASFYVAKCIIASIFSSLNYSLIF